MPLPDVSNAENVMMINRGCDAGNSGTAIPVLFKDYTRAWFVDDQNASNELIQA